jgi:hypothetical protein
MKKYITCTFLNMMISFAVYAQADGYPVFGKIITPYRDFEGSFRGKNLLFENDWVKARLLTAYDSVIKNDSFRFNFDKINRKLIATADYKKVFEIDWREFKAIQFYLGDSSCIFRHIYILSNKDLFQVMISGNAKYSLYKTTHTKWVRGMYGSGLTLLPYDKLIDHYEDATEYCILFPNREYRVIYVLKRSAIERIFKLDPDGEKVNDFFNLNGNKERYSENDLLQLISYLNMKSL